VKNFTPEPKQEINHTGDSRASLILDIDVEAHACRWATQSSRILGMHWGKWHWTEDAMQTICGFPVRIANERGSFLPDTDDDPKRVDCKNCLDKIQP